MTEVSCAWCGATVRKRWPSEVRERNFCNHTCLGKYRSEHYVGSKAANWKGGLRWDRGRAMVHAPSHPNAQSNGYVYRYRLVMEDKLGRPLRDDEIVHHVDGDCSNDQPDNLMVMSQSEHVRNYGVQRKRVDHAEI